MADRNTATSEHTRSQDSSLTITFRGKEGRRIRSLAAATGQDPAVFVQTLVERQLELGDPPPAMGTRLEKAIAKMSHRTPDEIAAAHARAMDRYRPRRSVPAGTTLSDIVSGQWPGDETDADIQAALDDVS